MLRMKDYICEYEVKIVFELFKKEGIRYVLIKNVNNELPSRLMNGKDIDVVIHLDDKGRFEKIMKKNFHRTVHPWGTENGWTLLYGLEEFEFWKLKNIEKDLYIDVAFSLACKSLMPKTWIPLDKSIQERLWKCKVWDEENSWWITDVETRFIYCIVRCVFDKEFFPLLYTKEIENLYSQINMEIVKELLNKVFFKYTDTLLDMIYRKKYDEIREGYIKYIDY